jgi:hypothetical protein
MFHPRAHTGRRLRRTFASIGIAAAVVLLTAATASAAGPGPGGYQITDATGTFSLLTTNNLVSGTQDDAIFYLSTTGPAGRRLPFALHLFNQTYKNIAVSTNGNIQPGVTPPGGSSRFGNDCLPSSAFGRPAVMPFWDDLIFNSSDTSLGFRQGIFTRTTGTAPHRRFTVSWQGRRLVGSTGPAVLAQVIFEEGSQNLSFVYGLDGGDSATIGIQSKQQLTWAQWVCNSGIANAVSSGERLRLTHFNAA